MGKELLPHESEWKRKLFARIVKWIGLGGLSALYCSLAATLYHSHVLMGKGVSPKELMLFLMMGLLSLMLLPQIILEVDYVKAGPDGLTLRNLLFRYTEKWSDIKSFHNPIWLKVAVLKGSKMIYLLNKRDLPQFNDLAETIEEKIPKLLQ
jgi:hypothetical protein